LGRIQFVPHIHQTTFKENCVGKNGSLNIISCVGEIVNSPPPEGKLMRSKNYFGAKSYFCANARKFRINIKGNDTVVSYMAKCELLESGKVPYGLMLTRMLYLWILAKMLLCFHNVP